MDQIRFDLNRTKLSELGRVAHLSVFTAYFAQPQWLMVAVNCVNTALCTHSLKIHREYTDEKVIPLTVTALPLL